jgi:hypothetical protein
VLKFRAGKLRWIVIFFIVLVLAKACEEVADADHNIYLPALPTTLINSIKSTQTVKWCANPAAHNYPNFIAQVEDVQVEYTKRVGIKFEKVNFGTLSGSGCQVQHNVQEFSCNGCAAHIFYANWPVVIEYKPSLGYSDWRSAIGHELGHGLLGLHERYRDSTGSIGCGGPEVGLTVMDCGSPFVRYPTTLDITRGCTVLTTSWCGKATVEPIVYPFWTGTCWNYSYWCFDPDDVDPFYGTLGTWYDPAGRSEWYAWVNGQMWNERIQRYYWSLPVKYEYNGTTWECIDNCVN